MKYHDQLAQLLQRHGVSVVFGVLGDANLFAMDSFVRDVGGRYVSTAHEGAAVLAAAGYAMTSGRVGVATVTHGPALTNVVTALTDATRSSTPVVLLAGDTTEPGHLQYIDQESVVAVTGAGWEAAGGERTLAEDLHRAFARAERERRPIVLNIPAHLQWADVDETAVPPARRPRWSELPELSSGELDEALGVVAVARRPLILAGRGAAGARAELEAIAQVLGAPVATSVRGMGMFHEHPHDLGVFGTVAHEVAAEVISRSDCVISFGASLNEFTTDRGQLLRGKSVIRVDTDPRPRPWLEGLHVVTVRGSSADAASTMATELEAADIQSTGFADDQLEKALAERKLPVDPPIDGIDLSLALRRLDQVFDRERTLVVDDGRFMLSTWREVSVSDPTAYVHTCSFASIGLSIGSAIGAQLGMPDRPALVVCGDGGFMSAGVAEFNTAVRHGIDMVVVVVNDRAYGAEHMQFRARGLEPGISLLDWPDFAAVADSMGGLGVRVASHSEWERALQDLQHRDRPVLIDLRVDPDAVPWN